MEFSRQLLDSFPYVTCTIWVFPDEASWNLRKLQVGRDLRKFLVSPAVISC